MRHRTIRLFSAGLVLGAAFAWTGMAVGQEAGDQPAAEQANAEAQADAAQAEDAAKQAEEAKADAEKQAAEAAKAEEAQAAEKQKAMRKLKIFTLTHRSPQEMQQILSMATRGPSPGGFPGAFPGATAPGGFVAAAAPALTPPGVDGAQPGAKASEQPPLIAADSAKRLLFVRGSEDQLKQIEQLVQAFDVTEENFKPQTFGNLHLIKVKDGNAGRVHGILSQLQLNSQMIHLGDLSLIAIHTGDSEGAKALAEQAQEVISKLEEADEPKAEEKKEEEKKAEEAKTETKDEEKKPAEDAAEKKDETTKDEEKKD